ncbi:MAG: von Willebrand factor type [Devosia sp.]|uniref:VWA domain-containing protein n=1 Tax=Devosia sp. TaxID=1871048 RepID=UPI00261F488C|nr:VWA domain-containing protein [Devosia sp.]MDB5542500.1 von Willebrand factor type [Devosia sp.]
MTFIWMDMLWLLALVPLLIAAYIWLMRRRKKSALRYANLAIVKQAMGRGVGWRRHVPPALLLAAITVLIIAVARPAAVVELASSRATVILSMDVSGSMRARDVEPSRIVAAQEAAKEFIKSQPADVQIGIVAFASAAVLVQAPTIDREALVQAINNFDLRRGTAVGSGVLVALATIFPDETFDAEGNDPRDQLGLPSFGGKLSQNLSATGEPDGLLNAKEPKKHIPVEPGSYESAVVILLTDGATTTGPDPVAAGRLAGDYGVRVFTVGFGSAAGDVVDFGGRSMRAQLDADTLQAIADATDGEYYAASSAADLAGVYNSLSTRLISEKKLTEIAFIFAGVGALLALAAAGLSLLWFGRVA